MINEYVLKKIIKFQLELTFQAKILAKQFEFYFFNEKWKFNFDLFNLLE